MRASNKKSSSSSTIGDFFTSFVKKKDSKDNISVFEIHEDEEKVEENDNDFVIVQFDLNNLNEKCHIGENFYEKMRKKLKGKVLAF